MALELNGTTGVSAVQAGAVESGDLPAGSVIQVVSVKSFNETDFNSSAITTTDYSASITPSSTSNKILILFSLPVRKNTTTTNAGISFYLYKNNSQIERLNNQLLYELSDEIYSSFAFNYIDNPNTTSSTVYDIRVNVPTAGPFRINDAGDVGELILMEIAG